MISQDKKFIDPEKILDQISIEPDMSVADFGCGSGGFTVALARRLKSGMVYAFDVQPGPLNALKANTLSQKIYNIRFGRADLEKPNGSLLSEGAMDMVVIANVLFQVENKAGMISEAKRVMKKGGKLLIVDWRKDAPAQIVKKVVSQETLVKTAERFGLKLTKELRAGNSHFGLLFIKV